ncbi:MAG: pilin [Patescibacteria group bacterium]
MDLFYVNVAYADVDTFIRSVNGKIINPIISLLFGLAVVYFLYGLVMFIMNSNSEEEKTTGKRHMIWGIIGFTIMIGVWGILQIVLDTLNIKDIDPKGGSVQLNNYSPTYTPVGGSTSGTAAQGQVDPFTGNQVQ